MHPSIFHFEMGKWPNAICVNDSFKILLQAVPPVIHRDIKSANILLDESMRARVCSFCWFLSVSVIRLQGDLLLFSSKILCFVLINDFPKRVLYMNKFT